MHVTTAFEPAGLLFALLLSSLVGLLCVVRPETVRAFAARYHPEATALFGDANAHRRFVRFCGWALLALASGLSLATLVAQP